MLSKSLNIISVVINKSEISSVYSLYINDTLEVALFTELTTEHLADESEG